MSHQAPAVDPLVLQLLPYFGGPSQAEADLTSLVADWRREAGHDADSPAVLSLLHDDFIAMLTPLEPEQRATHLASEVLLRELRALSRRTWTAAQGLKAGTFSDDAGRTEGRAVLAAIESMAPEVTAIASNPTPQSLALRQALEDTMLEALYLVERRAMSRRFKSLFDSNAP